MTTVVTTPVAPNRFQALWLASRPKTLVAGAIPVFVGSALAIREDMFKPLVAFAALCGALFIQIGTNLANDYFDFKKGADTSERLGPPRATQREWLTPNEVLAAAIVSMLLAFLIGLYITAVGGWPIFVVGLISIAAGFAYTGGPFPLAYHGLGEIFVLIFFGLVAVCGTYFIQTQTVTLNAVLASLPVGLFGVALLSTNNLRDIPTDTKASKRTLAVRFGETFARYEWLAAVLLAFFIVGSMLLSSRIHPLGLFVCLTLRPAMRVWEIVETQTGSALNEALGRTAKLQMTFGILFALALCFKVSWW